MTNLGTLLTLHAWIFQNYEKKNFVKCKWDPACLDYVQRPKVIDLLIDITGMKGTNNRRNMEDTICTNAGLNDCLFVCNVPHNIFNALLKEKSRKKERKKEKRPTESSQKFGPRGTISKDRTLMDSKSNEWKKSKFFEISANFLCSSFNKHFHQSLSDKPSAAGYDTNIWDRIILPFTKKRCLKNDRR
jgi:hypothetical protein